MTNIPQVQEVFHTPATAVAAVTRVRQDGQDVALLHSLATMTANPEVWPNLREADIVGLFLDLILRMSDRTVPPIPNTDPMPLWALPLQGLFNIMVGIQRTQNGFKVRENRDAAVKIFNEAPAICLRIYDDKARLCGSEIHSEDLRRCVTQWIQATWNGGPMLGLDGAQREMKASHVIELATCCWVFANTIELRGRAASSLPELLTQPQPTPTELDQVITAAGSYDKLINSSASALQSVQTVDNILVGNMTLLVALTGQISHIELLRQYAKLKAHHDVMTAVRRQMSRHEVREDFWRVLEYGGMLLVNIVNEASSPTDELTTLLAQRSLIPLLGGVLLRCAQAHKQSPPWSSLISLLKHTCTCRSSTCRVRTSPLYVAALRKHLSWRWWPTLRRLHIAPEFQKEWLLLGRVAGLVDTTERQKYETLPNDVGGCCVRGVNVLSTVRRSARIRIGRSTRRCVCQAKRCSEAYCFVIDHRRDTKSKLHNTFFWDGW